MSFAIETKGITREFHGINAVNNIDLSIKNGELFGLLGPNGAGKTTLINMLISMIEPSTGSASVCGFDVVKDAPLIRQKIGVVFQDITLDDRLTGRENLDLHARLYGLNKESRKQRIDEVLSLVDLSDRADSIVKTYSGGMMRRLEIARGFIHKPDILFLDEPTIGLDLHTRTHIWKYIKNLSKKEGLTVVLTTHYMEEADLLCDRIGIIDHGEIVALDTPKALKNMLGGDIITLKLKESNLEELCSIYKNHGFENVVSKNNEIFISVMNGEQQIPDILKIALNENFNMISIDLHKPTLDDVFLNYTGRALRDESPDKIIQPDKKHSKRKKKHPQKKQKPSRKNNR